MFYRSLVLTIFVFALSCTNTPAPSLDETTCATNDDCGANQACSFQARYMCASTCTTNADCPTNYACSPDSNGTNICAPSCTTDCGNGFGCTTNGVCFFNCAYTSSTDCSADGYCAWTTDGRCIIVAT